jgi:hypothetical protein
MLDPGSAIAVGKSVLEFGKSLNDTLERAKGTKNVIEQILFYLQAAQGAVQALGLERQRILLDASCCDLANREEATALFRRTHAYLKVDVFRPVLTTAVCGLYACLPEITSKSTSALWKRRNKSEALQTFTETVHALGNVLSMLSSNFYPGGSGMGVATLSDILKVVERAKNLSDNERSQPDLLEPLNEELGDRVAAALQDSSHQQWLQTSGDVEVMVVQLRNAFSIGATRSATLR